MYLQKKFKNLMCLWEIIMEIKAIKQFSKKWYWIICEKDIFAKFKKKVFEKECLWQASIFIYRKKWSNRWWLREQPAYTAGKSENECCREPVDALRIPSDCWSGSRIISLEDSRSWPQMILVSCPDSLILRFCVIFLLIFTISGIIFV